MTGPIDQPEPQSPAPESVSLAPDTVGNLLRAQRLALGRDVAFVAEHLRIRAAYIRAIEEGRYMDLPGSTYAIGFVRSYAEFLGLDPAETVRRFKDETAGGLHNKPELFFPSPVSEGRIPGGAILFLGLILASTAYGAWYYLSSRDVSIAELVPALPERMQALIGMGSSEPPLAEGPIIAAIKTEPAARTEPAPAVKTEPAPAATPQVATKPADPVKPAEPHKPVETAHPSEPPKPAETSKPVETPKPAEAAKPAEPARPVEAPKPVAAAPPAMPAAAHPVEQVVPPDEEEAAPKPVQTANAPALPTEHPPPVNNGKVYGAYNTDSRITLRSRDTAWVEIHDKGKKVWAQTLRNGDIYRVPNNAALTLMTGSAGALEVFVDGKATPSLGQMGTVRRGIQLDPEKLQAGQ